MPVTVERLDQPLEPITLPRGGRTLPAQDFTLGMQKLWQRVQAAGEDAEEAGRELVRRCVPGVTEEEIDDLTPAEALWIIAYCSRRLTEVTAHLKNAGGAAAANSGSPSAPTTSTSTPSPASPAPSGATGSTRRRNRSAARSTPLTA